MHKQWFETWFSTAYYDTLYQHRNTGEASQFIDKLLDLLKMNHNARVLDLACGKGRHANYLSSKGYDVTGVDISYKSIQLAAKQEKENLSFFQHDMRNIFRINYFDSTFNFFTSFGYFYNANDDAKALKAIAAGLKQGGYFVIDFLNVDFVLKELVEEESKTIDGINFIISKCMIKNFITKKITVQDKNETFEYYERVKAITKPEFELYLKANNLKLKHIFGDYELQPFHSATSERLIIIAQK
ncbi:MAG: class I SAM-dependent methyltransferase [Chitinophagales bacterium]